MRKCVHCEEKYEKDDLNVINGDYVCDTCRDEMYVQCHNCEEWLLVDDAERFDGEYFCESCFEDSTFVCDYCGDREYQCDAYETVNNHLICSHCAETHFRECESCGRYVHEDNAIYDEDEEEYYCQECHGGRKRVINSYSTRIAPTFQFASGEPHHQFVYGVELEVDAGGTNNTHASKVNELLGDMTMCKTDGSLGNGFEIVSYPCSLAKHKEMAWEKAMEYLVKHKYLSHSANTCGLHVHINRKCLGNNKQEIDRTIAKMLLFTEINWTALVKFSRREERGLSWAKRYGVNKRDTEGSMLSKANCGDRYRCINLCPSATVEMRIFRGTLLPDSFYATLEFVDGLVHFCKEKGVLQVKEATMATICDYVGSETLTNYMNERSVYGMPQDELSNLLDLGTRVMLLRNEEIAALEESVGHILSFRGATIRDASNNRYRLNVSGVSSGIWVDEKNVTTDFTIAEATCFEVGDRVFVRRNPLNAPGYDVLGAEGTVLEIMPPDMERDGDGRYLVELENDYAFMFHSSCLSSADQPF